MVKRNLSLSAQIERIEKFQRRWMYEVEAFYRWERTDGFNDSPHERLRERAEEIIRSAIDHLESQERYAMGDASPAEVHILLHAIGTEVLLNAILLEKDWEKFMALADLDANETPTLNDCLPWLMGNLPEELGDEERKRVLDVLTLLRVKRNNIAHFGYYRFSHADQRKEIYRILAFLFQHYFGKDEIVEELVQRVAELQGRYDSGKLDYPQVNLGLDLETI